MKHKKPSALELRILGILWKHGPSSARSVLESLDDGKSRAYTSVLSVMQVMEKKGLLTHSKRGVTNIYRPQVKKSDLVGQQLRTMIGTFFGGSVKETVQHLIVEGEMDRSEIDEIQKIIRDYQGRNRQDDGSE